MSINEAPNPNPKAPLSREPGTSLSPSQPGGGWGEEVGRGGEKPWKDSFPIRPRAGTNGRKRLSWALRTTDRLGVRRPQPLLGQSSCPRQLPSTLARGVPAPAANHRETRGRKRPALQTWLPEVGSTATRSPHPPPPLAATGPPGPEA